MKKSKKTNVILSETKNLMRSFTFVQDDNESGRSMVEMLGVLAVMGVLSVGGVAMYTNAMNKYRANELLNESSKRAVVIATQILSGKSISADMINQFDNNGTTFTGVEAVGTNQFKLTLSGVDDDVCTQLKATVGSNTIIQEVGDKCAYLTFNNDLSKGTTSSGTGGSNGGSGQQEPEPEPVDLCTGVDCNTGTCSNGKCDCTGTGYTGDHCEILAGPYCSVPGNCKLYRHVQGWNDTLAACGSEENVVTLEDVGCTVDGCENYNSVKAIYNNEWLTFCVQDSYDLGLHYDIDDGTVEFPGGTCVSEDALCK